MNREGGEQELICENPRNPRETKQKMFIDKLASIHPSVKRHAMKTITWRIVGTIDSVVLAWIVTGDPMVGLKIGGLELFTKMILYFIHERVWYKINFGLPHRKG